MNRVFVFGAALAVALFVSGCTAGSLSEAEQQSLAAAATSAPKLQPGDKIRVNVFGEESGGNRAELWPQSEKSGAGRRRRAPILCGGFLSRFARWQAVATCDVRHRLQPAF